jgi:hypothetical protein
MTLAAQGFHFRKVASKIRAPSIKDIRGLEQASDLMVEEN